MTTRVRTSIDGSSSGSGDAAKNAKAKKKTKESSGGEGSDSRKMMLIGIAAACIIIAGVVLAWQMGAFAGEPEELPVQVTAPEASEPKVQREFQRQIEIEAREFERNPPAGS